MANGKTEYTYMPKVVTPKAAAKYAWLNKRDQMSEKYQITVMIPKDTEEKGRLNYGKEPVDMKTFIKTLLAQAKEHGAPCKLGEKGVHIKDGDKHKNTDFKGHWVIEAKSNKKPTIIDTKGNPVSDEVTVFGGDLVKVEIAPTICKTPQGAIYFPFYVERVMLIEKGNGGGQASDFGEEDGYVASSDAGESDFGEDGDDDDKDDF